MPFFETRCAYKNFCTDAETILTRLVLYYKGASELNDIDALNAALNDLESTIPGSKSQFLAIVQAGNNCGQKCALCLSKK